MNRTVLIVLTILGCGLVMKSADCCSAAANGLQTPAVAREMAPKWIWLGPKAKNNQAVVFRTTIVLKPGSVSSAKLYASCDNRMSIDINGQHVLASKTWQVPEYADVTKRLQPGHNIITAHCRNDNGPAGFLMRLVVESPTDATYAFVTDATWQASERQKGDKKRSRTTEPNWSDATVVGKLGDPPRNQVNEHSLTVSARLREPTATPIEQLVIKQGFQVELLYSVPKATQGSWVNMCVDPKGRLIVSDQSGKLYRVMPPPVGADPAQTTVVPIAAPIGSAQGLVWAFDSLYVMVNGKGGKSEDSYSSGLYRVRDTDGDDQLDQVELLRAIHGGGEHGPHAVLLAPDGKSLYVVCGDGTQLTDIDRYLEPPVWNEDLLLPRIHGRGFMQNVMAPGGHICRVDPDGKRWELVGSGFRNEFDAAFNRNGDLFTYDADMEWDMNTPWYRPTRVCHVVSGAEFGWRNGSGKWPPYLPDSVPPVIDIGPGSPTGVVFGYGARFPAKYQEALFLCDWSYGKLYALHLTPMGASYTGTLEEFLTGTPLPLTDIVVNPQDGAMYITIGGRRAKSGLYRITYIGSESTAPSPGSDAGAEARAARHRLEAFHGQKDPRAVDVAWPYLGHSDRFLRYAARVALEHQNPHTWQDRALAETDSQAALTALLALTRVGDKSLQQRILDALDRIPWNRLTQQQQITLLRDYGLTFLRMGAPDQATRQRLIARFDPAFPAESWELNAELCQMLVYLQAPGAAAKTIPLLEQAPTQEEQMGYAKSLRCLKTGWTIELRTKYFQWFAKAAGYRGGASFALFVQHIKDDAVRNLTESEKKELKPVLDAHGQTTAQASIAPQRPLVNEWTMDELLPIVETGLIHRDFDRGRALFAAANCFACHRFHNEGGAIGSDLTAVSGRFSRRDLLESILEPSKVISDLYAAVTIVTIDGQVVNGRIVNLSGDSITVNTDMLDPTACVSLDRRRIELLQPSKTSMMPTGLLNTLHRDEILDLFAYLLSQGDRNHPMFDMKSHGHK